MLIVGASTSVMVRASAATVTLKVKPDQGHVGKSVTITGSGFLDDASVTIKFGSTSVMVTSSSRGTISTPFTIPNAVAGTHTLTAMDGTNKVTASFTVTASISLSPKSGKPGKTTTVTGMGFAASSTVNITFDGSLVETVETNSTRNFSFPLVIPSDPTGSYPIVATDSSGNSASAMFKVT